MRASYPVRALALALSLSTPVTATTELPPVLVSAARSSVGGLDIPAATTVIGRREIEDSGAGDIAALLRRVVGVHVSDGIGDGGGARIDMRGFGGSASSNVAVLVNGRKINPASDTATLNLNGIDLDNVEQIEIVQGSAGTLYGNQAVGGLINIITRRPDTRSRRLTLGAGSYDAWQLSAGLTERLDRLGLGLAAYRRASDNYRDHNASDVKRLDGRLEVDHHGGLSYLEVQLLDDYVETPGALFADELAADRRRAVFPNDYLDTSSRVLRLGTERALDVHWRLEGELALRDDRRDFVQSFRGFPGSRSTQDRESIEFTPRLVGRYAGADVTLGVDLLSTDYRLVTAFGPQGNQQDIAAAYAQLTQPLSTALSATAGVRHARVDNDIDNNGASVSIDDSVTVGSLGLSYRPAPAWRLFLRADQNYRFAKVDEHTNVPFGQPVGLDTQRGVSYEAGGEYAVSRLRLNARAYRLDIDDEISFDAVSFTNVNLPHSRRYGLTLGADADLGRSLRVGAGYDYTDSEIRSGTHAGSRVPLVPEHRATLYAEYRPDDHWLLRLDAEYVGEQFLGGDYANAAAPLADYTVANLVVHRDIGDWRLSAKVNNLFDQRYSETGASSFAGDGFNPAPERNLWVGASYRFED